MILVLVPLTVPQEENDDDLKSKDPAIEATALETGFKILICTIHLCHLSYEIVEVVDAEYADAEQEYLYAVTEL